MTPAEIKALAEANPHLWAARAGLETRHAAHWIVTIANELKLPVPEVATAFGFTATQTNPAGDGTDSAQ